MFRVCRGVMNYHMWLGKDGERRQHVGTWWVNPDPAVKRMMAVVFKRMDERFMELCRQSPVMQRWAEINTPSIPLMAPRRGYSGNATETN